MSRTRASTLRGASNRYRSSDGEVDVLATISNYDGYDEDNEPVTCRAPFTLLPVYSKSQLIAIIAVFHQRNRYGVWGAGCPHQLFLFKHK
jgi:hypothetical protein